MPPGSVTKDLEILRVSHEVEAEQRRVLAGTGDGGTDSKGVESDHGDVEIGVNLLGGRRSRGVTHLAVRAGR